MVPAAGTPPGSQFLSERAPAKGAGVVVATVVLVVDGAVRGVLPSSPSIMIRSTTPSATSTPSAAARAPVNLSLMAPPRRVAPTIRRAPGVSLWGWLARGYGGCPPL